MPLSMKRVGLIAARNDNSAVDDFWPQPIGAQISEIPTARMKRVGNVGQQVQNRQSICAFV